MKFSSCRTILLMVSAVALLLQPWAHCIRFAGIAAAARRAPCTSLQLRKEGYVGVSEAFGLANKEKKSTVVSIESGMESSDDDGHNDDDDDDDDAYKSRYDDTTSEGGGVVPQGVATENITLSFAQIKPFLDIAIPFFREDKTARNSLLGVLALTIMNSGVSVAFSFINRDFYNALSNRNEPEFYAQIGLFFGFLSLAVPLTVAYRFYREKLSLYWREALTARVLEQYCSNRTFYDLESSRDPSLDNPDQRITEDIRSFTRTSLDFLISLLSSLIDLVSFSAVLFQIYPLLFAAIVMYAGAGSLITTNLGQALVGLNYKRLISEANFRFTLIRVRENSESIAFYDNSARSELLDMWTQFRRITTVQNDIINTQRNLEMFTTAYRYLVQILPSLIIAPLYFAKKVELGTITQSYGAFNHILGDFSIIINQFEALSSFSAGLTRLNDFIERINSTKIAEIREQKSRTTGVVSIRTVPSPPESDIVMRCVNLTVRTPDGSRTLIGGRHNVTTAGGSYTHLSGINVTFRRDDKILIEGPSGAGKSSFVRAIAGLWKTGSGIVEWSDGRAASASTASENAIPSDLFFLPQKPYNLLGSLRQQIMYPLLSGDSDDRAAQQNVNGKLLQVLERVNLGGLATRMGGGDGIGGLYRENDWSKVLSLGEQQRLAFARVLFNRPSVVVLDEATSALDMVSEQMMYEALAAEGVTYISVGHRPSLRNYHTSRIVLSGPYAQARMEPISS